MSAFSSKQELKKHLQDFHNKTPFSDFVEEIVYGAVDGIVTTLAVVAGFFGANSGDFSLGFAIVVLFGLANLLADGASMGLGNFLSKRANHNFYLRQREIETLEIEKNSKSEFEETIFLLKNEGFEQNDAEKMASIISKNKKFWIKFMMEHELDMHDETDDNNALKGLVTFLSFVVFGFLPILPFVFLTKFFNFSELFISTLFFSGLALILLGYFRSLITMENKLKAMFETLLVGSVSGLIAFVVGVLIY